jgi:serine/threonine protein kinase
MENTNADTICAFRAMLADDTKKGIVRTLREYLELFPSIESEVVSAVIGEREQLARSNEQATVVKAHHGTRIGRLYVTREIGRGGLATTYLAHDPDIGIDVAVKVYHKSEDETIAEHCARVKREANIAARIDHPGVRRIIGIEYTDDGLACLVEQFVHGPTLAEVLAGLRHRRSLKPEPLETTPTSTSTTTSTPTPQRDGADSGFHSPLESQEGIRQLATIVMHAARALQECHNQYVVHRDVKPSNIIIGPNQMPVLIDFGLASMLVDRELQPEGYAIGTPLYMAPETITGVRIDHRVDIYALGITLFECLALERPYKQANELLRSTGAFRASSIRQLNPRVSQELEFVIDRAMANDVRDRYDNASDFESDLRSVITGGSPKELTLRRTRRIRLAGCFAIISLFIASVALYALSFKGFNTPGSGVTLSMDHADHEAIIHFARANASGANSLPSRGTVRVQIVLECPSRCDIDDSFVLRARIDRGASGIQPVDGISSTVVDRDDVVKTILDSNRLSLGLRAGGLDYDPSLPIAVGSEGMAKWAVTPVKPGTARGIVEMAVLPDTGSLPNGIVLTGIEPRFTEFTITVDYEFWRRYRDTIGLQAVVSLLTVGGFLSIIRSLRAAYRFLKKRRDARRNARPKIWTP